ncbi:MAG: hypothetical protein R2824_35925 [Saprospiraceae bacterium]|nr:hypothetical protein [Lewinella sp.]
MSTLELKNYLHKLVVETDDPVILEQVTALFKALVEGGDWWENLSDEEKQKIDIGMKDLEMKKLSPYDEVKGKAMKILSK